MTNRQIARKISSLIRETETSISFSQSIRKKPGLSDYEYAYHKGIVKTEEANLIKLKKLAEINFDY